MTSDDKPSLYRFDEEDSCFFRWLPWNSPLCSQGVPAKVYQPDPSNHSAELLEAGRRVLFVVSPYAPGDEGQALRIDLHLCRQEADAEFTNQDADSAIRLLSLPVDPDNLAYSYVFQEGRLCLREYLGKNRTRLTFQSLPTARVLVEDSPSSLILPLEGILLFCFDSGKLAVLSADHRRCDQYRLTLWEMKECRGEEPVFLLENSFHHHSSGERIKPKFLKVCPNGWFHLKLGGYVEEHYFFSPDLSVRRNGREEN